jgi:hypothetical protein
LHLFEHLFKQSEQYGTGYSDDPDISGELVGGWQHTSVVFCDDTRSVAPVVASFRILESAHHPLFRSCASKQPMFVAPQKCYGRSGMVGYWEEEEYSGGIRVPDAGSLLLSLARADSEASAKRRNDLFRAIDRDVVLGWYRDQLGLIPTIVILCQAARGLVSFQCQKALSLAKFPL